MKKFILLSLTVLLGASLFLTGCGDAEGGAAGPAGSAGSAGSAVVTGDLSAKVLQILVDRGNPILIAGDAEIGAGYVDLKGASITAAADLTFASGGVTLNAAKASIVIEEGGSIDTANATIVIPATEPAWVALTTGSGTLAPLASLADINANTDSLKTFAVETLKVDATGNVIGLSPDVALTALLGKVTKLVVSGAYETAEAVVTFNAKVVPLGSITHTGATSLALPAAVYGDVATAGATVSVAAATVIKGGLTASAAALATIANTDKTIEIGGDLKTTGTTGALTVSGSGAITVKGNVAVKGAASLGGNLTVSGKADFGGTLTNSAAAVLTVGADSTVTGVVTTGTGGLTIAGTGKVALAAVPATATVGLKVKTTGGVALPADTLLGTLLKVTTGPVTVVGDGTNATTIKSDAALTVATGGSVNIGTSAKVTAGGGTGKVEITGARLKTGTYTATDAATATLSLAVSTELEVANGGLVNVPGAGQIAFGANANSKLVLLPGGALELDSSATFIKTGGAVTNLTVSATDEDDTAAKGTITGTAPNFTLTKSDPGVAGSAVFGTAKVTINTNAITNVALEAAGVSPADGKITAGAGTKLIFAGTS